MPITLIVDLYVWGDDVIIPIEINIKVGDFNYHFNLNLEIKEVNVPLKELPIEIHPEILDDNKREGDK